MFRILFMTLSIILICFAIGLSEDNNNQETWNSIIETQQANGDIKQTETSLVKLAHYIDLWHKANLKGDRKLILSYEEDILDVIKFDIRTSQAFVTYNEKKEADENDKSTYLYDPGWKNINKMSSILKAKKRLAGSFTRTTSFSNKLRLLGDYQELMRRELDLSRVKLAEDWEDMGDELLEEQQD